MPETLVAFLKQRSERSYRHLLALIKSIPSDAALRDRHAAWPTQQWGIGQDGSIAGIVFHVAAWKQLTLPLLQPGGKALSQSELDRAVAPAPDDWPGIIAWYAQVGATWNEALASLSEDAFDAPRRWGGATLSLGKIVIEMYEHDVQHASQIEYLCQRHLLAG